MFHRVFKTLKKVETILTCICSSSRDKYRASASDFMSKNWSLMLHHLHHEHSLRQHKTLHSSLSRLKHTEGAKQQAEKPEQA